MSLAAQEKNSTLNTSNFGGTVDEPGSMNKMGLSDCLESIINYGNEAETNARSEQHQIEDEE